MKRIITFFGIASAAVLFTVVGFTYAGVRTQSGGSQLLADGDMEKAGTGSWTVGGGSISKVRGSAIVGKLILRSTRTETGWNYGKQTVCAIGKTYRITGWARSDGTEVPKVTWDQGTLAWTGTNSTAWQRIDATKSAITAFIGFGSTSANLTGYVDFDDLVVTEYSGRTVMGGKQLLADGDMEKEGTGDWVGYAIQKIAGGVIDGKRILRLPHNSPSTPYVYQNVLITRKTYKVTGWARSDGSAVPRLGLGGALYNWIGTASTLWQKVSYIGISTDPAFTIYSYGGTTGNYTEWDGLVVTEDPGRTVMGGKQLVTDGDMEKASSSPAWAVSGGVITKEAGGVSDGHRILRVTNSVTTGAAYQNNSALAARKRFHLTGWARSDGSARPTIGDGIGYNNVWEGAIGTTSWQKIDLFYTSGYPSLYLSKYGVGGTYVEFDNIVVTEL
jgi:hypothetical protein